MGDFRVNYAHTITLEEYRRREAAGETIPFGGTDTVRRRTGVMAMRVDARVRIVEQGGLRD